MVTVCTEEGTQCQNGSVCILRTDPTAGTVANYCKCPRGFSVRRFGLFRTTTHRIHSSNSNLSNPASYKGPRIHTPLLISFSLSFFLFLFFFLSFIHSFILSFFLSLSLPVPASKRCVALAFAPQQTTQQPTTGRALSRDECVSLGVSKWE